MDPTDLLPSLTSGEHYVKTYRRSTFDSLGDMCLTHWLDKRAVDDGSGRVCNALFVAQDMAMSGIKDKASLGLGSGTFTMQCFSQKRFLSRYDNE